ncbi:MAG: alpha/beta hydrolase [Bacteroidetes bacterium]|nr:alpha/beta hydrolase [Bacteroidota bacterium]
MRYYSLILLLIGISTGAQERYRDDLFTSTPALTLEYAVKDKQSLKLDLYQPKEDTLRKRPLIVYMHGGGFSGGKRDDKAEVNFARISARKGYVFASISYRLTRKGKSFNCTTPLAEKMETFRLAAEDVLDAVKFLLRNDSLYGIDNTRVILGGSSAGAEGVLSAVYNDDFLFNNRFAYKNFEPAAVISFGGAIPDERYLVASNAVPGVFFHGMQDDLVPYKAASHHYCGEDEPGYFMLNGSRTLADKLKTLDKSYMICSFKNLGHEAANIPFEFLDDVYHFLKTVVVDHEFFQAEFVQNYKGKP